MLKVNRFEKSNAVTTKESETTSNQSVSAAVVFQYLLHCSEELSGNSLFLYFCFMDYIIVVHILYVKVFIFFTFYFFFNF